MEILRHDVDATWSVDLEAHRSEYGKTNDHGQEHDGDQPALQRIARMIQRMT